MRLPHHPLSCTIHLADPSVSLSPALRRPEKSIKYRSTWIAVIVVMVVSSLLSLVLRAHLILENRKRDARAAAAAAPRAVGDEDEKAVGEEDASEYNILEDNQTDYTNPAFRYSL